MPICGPRFIASGAVTANARCVVQVDRGSNAPPGVSDATLYVTLLNSGDVESKNEAPIVEPSATSPAGVSRKTADFTDESGGVHCTWTPFTAGNATQFVGAAGASRAVTNAGRPGG